MAVLLLGLILGMVQSTQLKSSLKNVSDELFYRCASNQMKANPYKCHLIASSDYEMSICVKHYNIASSNYENLLGVKINNELNLNISIDKIC